jgi:hypothetical protein
MNKRKFGILKSESGLGKNMINELKETKSKRVFGSVFVKDEAMRSKPSFEKNYIKKNTLYVYGYYQEYKFQ